MSSFWQVDFLVADDIMDSSITRRGQPCWCKNPKVGMIAINDAFMLEAAIYTSSSRTTSRRRPTTLILLSSSTRLLSRLSLVSFLIFSLPPEDEVDLSKFSLEKHSYIVTYKTAFYSFYLPVALAMYMAGIYLSRGPQAG